MEPKHTAYSAYLGATATLGAAVVALSLYRLIAGSVSYQWLILAYLTLLTGAFSIKIPASDAKFSVSDTFVFINTILFGAAAGALTAALDGFVGSLQTHTPSRRNHTILFNTAVLAISAFAAGEVFFYFLGSQPLYQLHPVDIRALALPTALSSLAYFLTNSMIVAAMIARIGGNSMFRIWRRLLKTSVIFLASAAAGALLAFNIREITPLALLVVVPILVAAYFLNKIYIGPPAPLVSENGPVAARPDYRRYHYFMVVLGLGFIPLLLLEVCNDGTSYHWVILASLAVFAGFVTVKIPSIKIKFSLADMFVFANIILFGPMAGAITAAIDGLAGSLRCKTRERKLDFTLFNMAATTLPAYIAGEMFARVLAQHPVFQSRAAVPVAYFFPVMILAITYYLLNSTSVAIIVALQAQQRLSHIWRENLLWGLMPPIACALGALFVAAGIQAMTPMTAAAILTMLAAVYITHKAAVARVPQKI